MKSLLAAIQNGRFIELSGTDKDGSLRRLAALIEAMPDFTSGFDFTGAVMSRERAATTAIGAGWACPHGRAAGEGTLACAIGWSPAGIEWAAPDSKPVHVVIMHYIPDSEKNAYLKEISACAKAIKKDERMSRFGAESDLAGARRRMLDLLAAALETAVPDAAARMSGPRNFIREVTGALEPLDKAYQLGDWESSVTGSAEANGEFARAHAAYLRYWADPGLAEEAGRQRGAYSGGDPLVSRQLELIRIAAERFRQPPEAIEELARLEAEIRAEYYNHRAVAGGREIGDNEIDGLLAGSTDSAEAREAWSAGKAIGTRVAEKVRELARARNRAARALGWRDHFQRSLSTDEIDEGRLIALFDGLDAATRGPFEELKVKIDALRAERFGVRAEELMPWHYGDRFFQEAPPLGGEDVNILFDGRDPVALAAATYDGMGLEVRDILERSDLYARPGKNQHAFCIHIDRRGDVRVLANAAPDRRWADTMLHELGHAVYDAYVDPGLPWLLRAPSHMLTTEAVAILMGSLALDAEWLTRVLGVPDRRAESAAAAAREMAKAERLIFTRWCLVMTNFEKALYEDPDRDLDGLWWNLVERYQLLRRPQGRKAPDWAAKIHIALVPVYYQNYELGHLVRAQLEAALVKTAGGIVGRPKAGEWLVEKVFRPGASVNWEKHVEAATGEPPDPKYFVEAVV